MLRGQDGCLDLVPQLLLPLNPMIPAGSENTIMQPKTNQCQPPLTVST
jgi:hypothetical protein